VAGSSGGGGNSAAALIDRRELERLERRVDDEERRAAAGLPPRALGAERRRIAELESEVESLRGEKAAADQVRSQQRHEIGHLKESVFELRNSMDYLRASVDSMRTRLDHLTAISFAPAAACRRVECPLA
jgi:chromosome segregation ATPase